VGIIKKIKDMFAKNIDCSNQLQDTIFYHFTKKNRVITIGANIVVPEGFIAILVCRDKITDVLPQGKFAITGATMPKTFSALKLLKANKKGKLPKNFKADIYFLCVKNATNYKFASFRPYVKKDIKYGLVKANCEGEIDIKIEEPAVLMKFLLQERAYISDELFFELLSGLIGDEINKKLFDCKYNFYEILTSPNMVYEFLNDGELNNKLTQYGINATNIRLESMNVKEKLQKVIEQDLQVNRQFVTDFNSNFAKQLTFPSEPIYNKQVNNDYEVDSSHRNTDFGYSTCPKCGQRINRGAIFCEKCGIKLTNIY